VTMKKNIHMTKKKLTVHLGEVLRAARLKAELTQADVAERVWAWSPRCTGGWSGAT
jgi:hypothetical protein